MKPPTQPIPTLSHQRPPHQKSPPNRLPFSRATIQPFSCRLEKPIETAWVAWDPPRCGHRPSGSAPHVRCHGREVPEHDVRSVRSRTGWCRKWDRPGRKWSVKHGHPLKWLVQLWRAQPKVEAQVFQASLIT